MNKVPNLTKTDITYLFHIDISTAHKIILNGPYIKFYLNFEKMNESLATPLYELVNHESTNLCETKSPLFLIIIRYDKSHVLNVFLGTI